MEITKLPAQDDVKMVYKSLLKSGWVTFSELKYNNRSSIDPWDLFPNSENFESPNGQEAEPLILVNYDLSLGIFDTSGMSFYDFDSFVTIYERPSDDELQGKVVFFPYENVDAYR